MQNKVLQNTLLIAAGVGVGVLGFFLMTKAQTASTDLDARVTVPGTVTIATDGTPFDATLTPGTINTANDNQVSVGSNNPNGILVTLNLADLDGNAGLLCADSNSDDVCDPGGNTFDADNNPGSYLHAASSALAGSALTTLPGATYNATGGNLGALPLTLYTSTGGTHNAAPFQVDYEAFTDLLSTLAGQFDGKITFTVTAQ